MVHDPVEQGDDKYNSFLSSMFILRADASVPWIRGSKERSRWSQNSRPQDERAKRAKGEEPMVTLDHNLVLEPVRLHVKLLCQDKRGAPIWLQKCLMRSEA